MDSVFDDYCGSADSSLPSSPSSPVGSGLNSQRLKDSTVQHDDARFVLEKLGGVSSYNGRALFKADSSSDSTKLAQLQPLLKILTRTLVSCVQEAHNQPIHEDLLDQHAPSHHHLHNFAHVDPATRQLRGGLVTSVSKHLVPARAALIHDDFSQDPSLAGRLQYTSFAVGAFQLHFFNVHLFPISAAQLTTVCDTIHRKKGHQDYDINFVCGDFNFILDTDFRFSPLTGEFSAPNAKDRSLSSVWSRRMTDFIELVQHDYTHGQTVSQSHSLNSLSRIDRIYVDVCILDTFDCFLDCSVQRDINPDFRISDHQCVLASFAPKPPPSSVRSSVPSWILKHPSFEVELQKVLLANDGVADLLHDPFDRLAHFQDVVFIASRNTKRLIRTRTADSLRDKYYISTLASRAHRAGDVHTVIRCLHTYSALTDFFLLTGH